MPLEQAGHVSHRFELAAAHPAKPVLEKSSRPARLLIFPELAEQFFHRPSPRHFQLLILQPGKFIPLLRAKMLRIIQPQLPRPLERFIALGQQLPSLLLKGGRVFSPFTGEFYPADVAICGRLIAGVGDYPTAGSMVIDASGSFIIPGLFDAHVHPETSLLSPPRFAEALVGHGVHTSRTGAAVKELADRSATLAVEEVNKSGGIPSSTAGISRPLVMVSCNTTGDLVRASTHLVSDLKVPAIVGPNTSQDTLDVSNKVTIQAGVVVVSPTAVAASIADLRDNDMTWLMIPTDDQRAPLMIKDINTLETQLNKTVKLSIIYRNDALGVGTQTALDALSINGKPLADQINAGHVHIDPYDAALTAVSSILTKEIDFAPDIVVLAGTAETVTKFLTPLEAGWTGATRPFYYFIDPSKGQDLLNAVTGNDALRLRVRGTGTLPNTASKPVNDAFSIDYGVRYGSPTTASGAGPSYDAVYSIAYALAATKDLPISGATVAQGLRKLAGGTESVNTGTQDLQRAFSTLAGGQAIKATGTNCNLEWDDRGVVTDGTIEMWCIGAGATPRYLSSGLVFDTKTQTYSGTYTPCQ